MSDESIPAPPDGYRRYDPSEMGEWSQSDFFDIVAVLWAVSFLLLGAFSYVFTRIDRLSIVVILAIIAIIIHEGLHALTGKLFGLEVTAGIKFKKFMPYILTYGRLQSRLQTAVILMAPLTIVSTFCLIITLILSLLESSLIGILIFGLINIVLSYYDLLDLRFTLNLPDGSKEYHSQENDVAYYVPKTIDSKSSDREIR